MLTSAELRKIGRSKLRDAEVLFKGRRYDGSVYLCGYALELFLKARVCTTLKWSGFPLAQKEFEGLQSFKVHKLEMLIKLAGRERIRQLHLGDWSIVNQWDSESRYNLPGTVTRQKAKQMIESTRRLLGVL